MTVQAERESELERSGVVMSDGVRLNVEVAGPADAPVTVLLVHGWTCSTRAWHNQVEDLPRILGPDAVRVVSYDHRGHGRSDAAPAGSTQISRLAEDLVTILDEVVGAGPVVYAGHSMGGMTLMSLADTHPDLFAPTSTPGGPRICAAALISTSCGRISEGAFGIPKRFSPAAAAAAPRLMNLVGARVDRQLDKLHSARSQAAMPNRLVWARRAGLRQVVFGRKADPAEVELFLADLAVVPGASYGGFLEAILQHDLGHALKVLDQIPVEIMHGTRDRLLPPRHANRIAAELPSARVWMYPGAGHMLMQERPRDVTHRLASLARKVTA
ncbi:alpha/beta hydrolase [Kribbella sp. NPDC026611]|uniref:alpha/beta fold hydrolase n=1 Tax=Kribbella sp. NPDC026611 TaxID=3154911 RepID=UPI0033C5F5A4